MRNTRTEQLKYSISAVITNSPFGQVGDEKKSLRNKSNICTWKCDHVVIHHLGREELKTIGNDDRRQCIKLRWQHVRDIRVTQVNWLMGGMKWNKEMGTSWS